MDISLSDLSAFLYALRGKTIGNSLVTEIWTLQVMIFTTKIH
jgi:hypothetical protein